MKKNNHSMLAQHSTAQHSTGSLWKWKDKLLMMVCFCFGLPAMAQPYYDINAHDATYAGNYVNYSITNHSFIANGFDGQVAASAIVDASNQSVDAISLIYYGVNPSNPAQLDYANPKMWNLNTDIKGKVVSLTDLGNGRLCVTMMSRNTTPNALLYIVLDCSDFNTTPVVASTHRFTNNGWHIYPLHTIYFDGEIYTCGFTQGVGTTANYSTPQLNEQKSAFVSRWTVGSTTTTTRRYQSWATPINATPNLSSTPSNDYDCAVRLKEINGELLVLGGANTYGTSYWGASSGTMDIISQAAWVAKINPTTLDPLPGQNHYYGAIQLQWLADNDHISGYYAVDIIPDDANAGQYYCMYKDANNHSMGIAHLEGNGQISIVFGLYNSISQFYSNNTRGYTLSSNIDPNGNMAMHGIYHTTSGDVYPFSTHFSLAYSNAMGLSGGATIGFQHENALPNNANADGFPTLNSSNNYYCPAEHPIATVQNAQGEFATMGRFFNGSLVQPRVISTKTDGSTSCPGTVAIDPIILNGFQLILLSDMANSYYIANTLLSLSDNGNSALSMADNYMNATCGLGGPYYRTTTEAAMKVADPQIKVFPIPARDVLNISAIQLGEGTTATLYDITGRKVQQASLGAGGTHAIKLTECNTGIYLLKITDGNGKLIHRQKVSVQ